MKTKKIYLKLILIIIFFICFYLAFINLNLLSKASADENTSYKRVMPTSSVENTMLTAPIDAYYGNEIIIIQNNNSLLFSNNSSFTALTNFTVLKQVKNFNDTSFLISDNGSIYSINKATLNKNALTYNDTIIGGNYFDLNAEFLITAYSAKATVYGINNNQIDTNKLTLSFDVMDDKPICINSNNDIFYVSKDYTEAKICKINASKISDAPEIVASVSPDKMIANTEYLFFIENNGIYRVPVSGGEIQQLVVKNIYCDYDLGNLISPSSLCLYNNNLFVSDSSVGAVQEFKISKTDTYAELVFTGYAVASGKSAYNRINSNATNIEKVGDKVAIFDSKKITLLIMNENFNANNTDLIKNYLLKDIENPSSFCLGKNKIILGYGLNGVKLLNINSGELSDPINISGSIKDICYNKNSFLVLSDDGNSTFINAVSEDDGSVSAKKNFSTFHAQHICADMDNNVYFSDENYIYKNILTEKIAFQNAKKITTDLACNLFACDGTTLKYFKNNWIDCNLNMPIKSFAMSFDTKDILFICNNDETIYKTENASNIAISSITIPEDFNLSSQTANFSDLKLYTTLENASIFKVNSSNLNFSFIELSNKESEYVFVCKVNISNDYELYALVGQNGVYLVNKEFTSEKEIEQEQCDSKSYITTGVNIYYFPIITFNGEYSLKLNEQNIRLNKSSEIYPSKLIKILDRNFYFVTVTINENVISGYIPEEFTLDILSENKEINTFSIATINECSIYSDKGLTNEICKSVDGEKIRLISTENGVSEILYFVNDGYIKCYISSENLKIQTDNSVRNVLIIIVAFTCACVSGIYFIVKKKNN